MENKINWNTYKFHCSGLSYLMTNSRKKDEVLSETAKSYLSDLWIKEVWGREKTDTIANKYMTKGTMCETDSIELLERVTGKKYFKNQKTLENDFVIGTPDITTPLIDIKTAWDMWTFMKVNEIQVKKDYYYQVLNYMWLLGHKSGTVAYTLVNTPELLITDDLYRLSFKLPEGEVDKYRNNYLFDDIPEKDRIKSYTFEYDEAIIETIKERIMHARSYLSILSL